MQPLAAMRRYLAAEDPHVAAANVIAMVLAWNTPFYPLYVIGAGGAAMHPAAWFTLAVFPVFIAVPAITRHHPLRGRVLLAAAGIVNTIWCTWLLGEASGTQLFLLPCLVLAPVIFRQGERLAFYGGLSLPFIVGLSMNGRYPTSAFACQGAACANLLWLNAVSVASLCIFLALLTARLLADGVVVFSQGSAAAPSMRQRRPQDR